MLPQATIFYEFSKMKLYELYCLRTEDYLGEIFVRACVFQYQKDHNKYEKDKMASEIKNGFLWLPQLLEAFEKYKNDTTYKTFIDFMPEIIKLQNSLDPQKIYDEMPTIIGTNIENGSDSVDYNIDHINSVCELQGISIRFFGCGRCFRH